MRDVYQVIEEKELEIVNVRQEIEALRSILPLLTDEDDDVPVDGPVYPSLRVVNRE
jgi:bifunctional pyridoxal-dependent enzyme with beta-cystathionase and maltose regulon repressor activities